MEMLQMDGERFSREVLAAGKPALVEFWAPWCVYCRRIGPAVGQLAARYAGRLTVGQVNIDEEPALAERYGIEVVPTLLFFRDGQPAGRAVAPASLAEIEDFVTAHWKE